MNSIRIGAAFCIHWNAETTAAFVIVSASEICPIVSAHVQFGELLRACPKRVYLHMRCAAPGGVLLEQRRHICLRATIFHITCRARFLCMRGGCQNQPEECGPTDKHGSRSASST